MAARIPDSLDRLSHDDLIGVVRELIHEVTRLRSENEKLSVAPKGRRAGAARRAGTRRSGAAANSTS
jgi:hypothetical protein